MKVTNVESLVLATVNAPYANPLDAAGLAQCLGDPQAMRRALGPMSSFFYEVDHDLQIEFAETRGIPRARLTAARKLMDEWSARLSTSEHAF